jgi:hypothetical protein
MVSLVTLCHASLAAVAAIKAFTTVLCTIGVKRLLFVYSVASAVHLNAIALRECSDHTAIVNKPLLLV